MALDLAAQAKIVDLRQRVLREEPVSAEELKEALEIIRASRGVSISASKSKTRKKSEPIDLDALFNKS